MRIHQPRPPLSDTGRLWLLLLALAVTILITTVIPSPASAQTPPHKFVGASNATLVNGSPAADGLMVVAYNDQGAAVASGTIVGGVWAIDVHSSQAASVRFAIGNSTWSALYSVVAGSLTEVSLRVQGTIVAADPAPTTTPIIRIGWEHYTLQAGEDLASVADRYGLSLDDVLERNPQIANPTTIGAGDVIVLRELGVNTSEPSVSQTSIPDLNALTAPLLPTASEASAPSTPTSSATQEHDGGGLGLWLILAVGAGGLALVAAVIWWKRKQNPSDPASDGGITNPDSRPGWGQKDRPSPLEAEPIFRAKAGPATDAPITLPPTLLATHPSQSSASPQG
jgi:hypothetical protein